MIPMALFCVLGFMTSTQSRELLSTSSDWNTLEWTKSMTPLPRYDGNMAVGYYNDTIHIFGGKTYRSQYVKFNIISQSVQWQDIGEEALSFNLYGTSKYYTQINHLFYAINPDTTNIIIYNLITETVSYSSTITKNVATDGCISSIDDLLFVIGGTPDTNDLINKNFYQNTTQIYNISSDIWTFGPSMNTGRAYHSCVIDTNKYQLYTIGGKDTVDDGDKGLDTIERIDIKNIANTDTTWEYTNSLVNAIKSASAIFVESRNEIYLFFGELTDTSGSSNTLASPVVISCISGTVTTLSSVTDSVYDAAAIFVPIHNKIYAFGGYDPGTVDTWRYLHLFTTHDPTKYPTNNPTDSPTNNPAASIIIADPTMAPSVTSHRIDEIIYNSTMTMTKSESHSSQDDRHSMNGLAFVIILVTVVACCIVMLIWGRFMNHRKQRELMDGAIDVGYVELSDDFGAEGRHTDIKGNNNQDQLGEDDGDDLYDYAAPTLGDNSHDQDEGASSSLLIPAYTPSTTGN